MIKSKDALTCLADMARRYRACLEITREALSCLPIRIRKASMLSSKNEGR